jgi:hypothetical protein
MFETQINGEAECGEALINGVPFSDANTASKINAGLNIITLLVSITSYRTNFLLIIEIIQVIDIQSQLINLIVSEKIKTK